ncbi:hydroxypyruvate isomerase family protein [Kibdelosporangium aridum]|uniref:Hydroxypyruvate isomerase n=1 Tax=Kibdelosporangium aridum TaxID=2030 RepID=A0A1W2EDJ3_KIBAR|nr:TIM barrel protein [Kibdelosporangium aridum]SMD07386.1 hydroxypyruvate isomerase [Kibdelosporangium aridum]
MRFDANLSWLFPELPFEQRFDAAAAAGFAGVEYASPYPYKPAQVRKWLSDAGLRQVLINTPRTCLDPDFRAAVSQGLDYAVALGSSFLHLVGGIRSSESSFVDYVANVALAAELARNTGVRLVLEVQNQRDKPGFVLDSHAQAAAVVEAVGAEHVGLMFDVYHAQIVEDDLVAALREFLPMTFHVQIADPPDRHEPGTGEVPWHSVFDVLRADYQGWIGCEYRPVADTVAGLRWVKELAACESL